MSVLPSKMIFAVAFAARSLLLEPGPLTVVMIRPRPSQRAVTEPVCDPPRLSSTPANVALAFTLLERAAPRRRRRPGDAPARGAVGTLTRKADSEGRIGVGRSPLIDEVVGLHDQATVDRR